MVPAVMFKATERGNPLTRDWMRSLGGGVHGQFLPGDLTVRQHARLQLKGASCKPMSEPATTPPEPPRRPNRCVLDGMQAKKQLGAGKGEEKRGLTPKGAIL